MRSTWCGTHQIQRMGFVHWPSRTWQQIWFNQSLYFLHWSLLKCICHATMNTLYQESPTLVWRSWQLCGVPNKETRTKWRLIKFPLKHIWARWSSIRIPKWVKASTTKANAHTAGSAITLAILSKATTTRMRTNWPTMWSFKLATLWFLQQFQRWVRTAAIWWNERPTECGQ